MPGVGLKHHHHEIPLQVCDTLSKEVFWYAVGLASRTSETAHRKSHWFRDSLVALGSRQEDRLCIYEEYYREYTAKLAGSLAS